MAQRQISTDPVNVADSQAGNEPALSANHPCGGDCPERTSTGLEHVGEQTQAQQTKPSSLNLKPTLDAAIPSDTGTQTEMLPREKTQLDLKESQGTVSEPQRLNSESSDFTGESIGHVILPAMERAHDRGDITLENISPAKQTTADKADVGPTSLGEECNPCQTKPPSAPFEDRDSTQAPENALQGDEKDSLQATTPKSLIGTNGPQKQQNVGTVTGQTRTPPSQADPHNEGRGKLGALVGTMSNEHPSEEFKTVPLHIHTASHSTREIMLNTAVFPDISVGDNVEIFQPGNPNSVLLLHVTNLDPTKGNSQVSVLHSICQNPAFQLKAFQPVVVRKANPASYTLSYVELTFKDQYVSQGEFWRLRNAMQGRSCFIDQRVSEFGINVSIDEMLTEDQKAVACGIIGDSTKFIIRSCSARLFWLVQMSKEMWNFSEDGDLYLERFLNRFVTNVFEKWTKRGMSHRLTIVFFTRTYFNSRPPPGTPAVRQDYDGRLYTDLYHLVLENETRPDWITLKSVLKREFFNFPAIAGWKIPGDQRKDNNDACIGLPSAAHEGNALEAINLCLDILDKHYMDRDLCRTGQAMVLVTPGTGVFEVDRELTAITKQRMMDNAIGCDFVSLTRAPLHVAPLFVYKPSPSGRDILDRKHPFARVDTYRLATEVEVYDQRSSEKAAAATLPVYNIPHWIHLSFPYHISRKSPVRLDTPGSISSYSHIEDSHVTSPSRFSSRTGTALHQVTPATTTQEHFEPLPFNRMYDPSEPSRSGFPTALVAHLQRDRSNTTHPVPNRSTLSPWYPLIKDIFGALGQRRSSQPMELLAFDDVEQASPCLKAMRLPGRTLQMALDGFSIDEERVPELGTQPSTSSFSASQKAALSAVPPKSRSLRHAQDLRRAYSHDWPQKNGGTLGLLGGSSEEMSAQLQDGPAELSTKSSSPESPPQVPKTDILPQSQWQYQQQLATSADRTNWSERLVQNMEFYVNFDNEVFQRPPPKVIQDRTPARRGVSRNPSLPNLRNHSSLQSSSVRSFEGSDRGDQMSRSGSIISGGSLTTPLFDASPGRRTDSMGSKTGSVLASLTTKAPMHVSAAPRVSTITEMGSPKLRQRSPNGNITPRTSASQSGLSNSNQDMMFGASDGLAPMPEGKVLNQAKMQNVRAKGSIANPPKAARMTSFGSSTILRQASVSSLQTLGGQQSSGLMVINPFDWSVYTSELYQQRLTHNRRRWSHLFPTGRFAGGKGLRVEDFKNQGLNEDDEEMSRDLVYNDSEEEDDGDNDVVVPLTIESFRLNWKSLASPGILPLTTDYYPDVVTLSRYQLYDYDLMLPEIGGENGYADLADLMEELVCQRLSQDFQLYVEEKKSSKIEMSHEVFGEKDFSEHHHDRGLPRRRSNSHGNLYPSMNAQRTGSRSRSGSKLGSGLMNSKLQRIDSYKMSNEDYKSVGRDTSGQGKWIASSPGTTRSTTGGKHSLGLCLDLAISPPSGPGLRSKNKFFSGSGSGTSSDRNVRTSDWVAETDARAVSKATGARSKERQPEQKKRQAPVTPNSARRPQNLSERSIMHRGIPAQWDDRTSQTIGTNQDIKYTLTMGHEIHEIEYSHETMKIKVVRQTLKEFTSASNKNYKYEYLLHDTAEGETAPVRLEFSDHTNGRFNWNHVDYMICGDIPDMSYSNRYRRNMFAILPVQPAFSTLSSNSQKKHSSTSELDMMLRDGKPLRPSVGKSRMLKRYASGHESPSTRAGSESGAGFHTGSTTSPVTATATATGTATATATATRVATVTGVAAATATRTATATGIATVTATATAIASETGIGLNMEQASSSLSICTDGSRAEKLDIQGLWGYKEISRKEENEAVAVFKKFIKMINGYTTTPLDVAIRKRYSDDDPAVDNIKLLKGVPCKQISARVVLDARKHGRLEWLFIQCDNTYTPYQSYGLQVQWMVAAGSSVLEFVNMLKRKAKNFNVNGFMQVPEYCRSTASDYNRQRRVPHPFVLSREIRFSSSLLERKHFRATLTGALRGRLGYVMDSVINTAEQSYREKKAILVHREGLAFLHLSNSDCEFVANRMLATSTQATFLYENSHQLFRDTKDLCTALDVCYTILGDLIDSVFHD